ncbi:ABC transporter substrate-binding protein, partial [Aldersonia kunmingensis]|uniref:ABC transporter substrate-binding protein n=1 Tax=Aldersonia kunmingensis TaxID=408066 RepID=UPI000A8D8336
ISFAGLGAHAVTDGCKSIASVLYDVPTAEKAATLIQAGAAKAGGPAPKHIKVPTSTTDFSSVAKSAGESDCAIVGLPNDQVAALAAAGASIGVDTKYYALAGALNDTVLSDTGTALEGAQSAVNFVVASNPAWDSAKAARDDVDWTGVYNQNTWAGYQVLANVVGKDAPTVDAAAVTTALSTASNVDTGLTAPIDFTVEFPVPGLNRVFNSEVVFVEAKDGEVVQNGDFQDLTPLFTTG